MQERKGKGETYLYLAAPGYVLDVFDGPVKKSVSILFILCRHAHDRHQVWVCLHPHQIRDDCQSATLPTDKLASLVARRCQCGCGLRFAGPIIEGGYDVDNDVRERFVEKGLESVGDRFADEERRSRAGGGDQTIER